MRKELLKVSLVTLLIVLFCIGIAGYVVCIFDLPLGDTGSISTIDVSNETTTTVVSDILVVVPNFTDTVEQSIKSVVHVKCPQWQGSGFVIDKHIICTARHVVKGVEDFEITFNDGRKVHATKAVSDKEHDVGFIWVEEDMNDVAKFGSIKDCKLGQGVFIVGSPYGDINFNSVSKGIISGLNRNWDTIDQWTGDRYGWEISFTSDSAAHPGNSGGAVFTMDGIVRGVLVGGYSPVLNCSMPCDLFMPDIEQIKMMFIMDKYQKEVAPIYSPNDYYNHVDNNEYYTMQ